MGSLTKFYFLLQKIFKQINLPERFIPYFLLFIIVYEEDGNAIGNYKLNSNSH